MLRIRPLNEDDKARVRDLLQENWGSAIIVTRGKAHQADELPGFIAIKDGKPAGLITYDIKGNKCEIITLNSLTECQGIGTALVDAVKDATAAAGCRCIWLITTNDNTAALRFWQKRDFKFVAVYPDAIEQSRRIKPEIPQTGSEGIPIRDEIELEMIL